VSNGRPDGFKACNGWNEVVTVWRGDSYTGGGSSSTTGSTGGSSSTGSSSGGYHR
jgi:hypothetical protein